tara:strand:- start:691 stop:837 length:147 start_codon:yes stop_codon:yes gene_type:complete
MSLLSMWGGAAVAFLISSREAVTIPLSRFDANGKELGESENTKDRRWG